MINLKTALKASLKMALGGLLGLLVFEGSLQIISHTPLGKVLPAIEPQLGQPDPDIGYAFTSDSKALWTRENRAFVEMNSLGMRDNAIEEKKQEGVYRVALSGDSIVEALQVENDKVFENIAEKQLQNDGQNVEIMNFAMAGSGPLRQLVRLEKFATPLRPDLTIMMMSSGDFMTGEMQDDSQNPGYKIDADGKISRIYGFRQRFSQRHANDFLGKAFLFLNHNSHTFRMLYDKKNASIQEILGLNSAQLPSQYDEKIAQPSQGCETQSLQKLHDFWVGQKPEKDWLVTQHFLKDVQAYTKNQKVIMGLYIPLTKLNCEEEQRQRVEIVTAIDNVIRASDITFIDWNTEVAKYLPSGYSQDNIDRLYGFGSSLGQGHLNYRGHEVYSRVLYSIVNEFVSK